MQICVLPYKSDESVTTARTSSNLPGRPSIPPQGESSTYPALPQSSSNASTPHWKAAIILPKSPGFKGMKDLVTTFATSSSPLNNLLNSSTSRKPIPKVNLHLPRFTLRAHLDLRESLSSLGLDLAFRPSNDFAPLSSSGSLFTGQATHDLLIEVNEEGTKMAAVTIVGMKRFVFPARVP